MKTFLDDAAAAAEYEAWLDFLNVEPEDLFEGAAHRE